MPYQLFQFQRSFYDHTRVVEAIAISSDGQTLISGSWDKTIKLWNLNASQVQQSLEGHKSSVTAVAIASNVLVIWSGRKNG